MKKGNTQRNSLRYVFPFLALRHPVAVCSEARSLLSETSFANWPISGILAFWHSGILAFWHSGILALYHLTNRYNEPHSLLSEARFAVD